MNSLIVFNAVAYSVAAVVMLGIVIFLLPGWYRLQYFISFLVFAYYAIANLLYVYGCFTSVDVSTMIRWVSVLMPLQLIGSAVVVHLLLKHIQRIEKFKKGGSDHADN